MLFGPFEKYVRPYRGRILLGALAIGIGQAAAARIPLLVGDAVDAIPTADDGAGLNAIQPYVIYILAMALTVALGGYAMRMLLGYSSNRIEYDIRTEYFAHLLKLPLSYYQQHRTGDLMARATNDLNSVHIFFTYGIRGIVDTVLGLSFTIGYM